MTQTNIYRYCHSKRVNKNLVNKSGPVSCGLISNYLGYYTNVWVEPINFGTDSILNWRNLMCVFD